jgi:hypothetical protein
MEKGGGEREEEGADLDTFSDARLFWKEEGHGFPALVEGTLFLPRFMPFINTGSARPLELDRGRQSAITVLEGTGNSFCVKERAMGVCLMHAPRPPPKGSVLPASPLFFPSLPPSDVQDGCAA